MPLDASFMSGERGRLFRSSMTRQEPPGFRVLKIEIAKLGNGRRLAQSRFLGRRVASSGNLAQDALRISPGQVWRPWRAVPANRLPALPPFVRPVDDEIGDGFSFLPPGAEPPYLGVKNGLTWRKGANIIEPDVCSFTAAALVSSPAPS